jgi:hypothetical protein
MDEPQSRSRARGGKTIRDPTGTQIRTHLSFNPQLVHIFVTLLGLQIRTHLSFNPKLVHIFVTLLGLKFEPICRSTRS